MDNLGQIWVIITIMVVNTVFTICQAVYLLLLLTLNKKLHFANEKTEAQRGLTNAKITQFISNRIWNVFSS